MGTLYEIRRVCGQRGLVIDVTGLHPFDLPAIARRPRPICRVLIGQMDSVSAERQQRVISKLFNTN